MTWETSHGGLENANLRTESPVSASTPSPAVYHALSRIMIVNGHGRYPHAKSCFVLGFTRVRKGLDFHVRPDLRNALSLRRVKLLKHSPLVSTYRH